MVVTRSGDEDSLGTPLPKFDAQICVLEHDALALERIGRSTTDIVEYVDEILDIGDDILLDPRKHDQLLFDDDSFSRSRKYWWASNLLVALRQNIEDSRKVHQQFSNDLIVPIINALGPGSDIETWPDGLYNLRQRAAKANGILEKLLDRIDFQQNRVDALRDGVSILFSRSITEDFLTFLTALQRKWCHGKSSIKTTWRNSSASHLR
jgi:hypothetical protein